MMGAVKKLPLRAVAMLAALIVAVVAFVLGAVLSGWKVADGQVIAPYELRHPDASGEVFEQDGQEYFEPAMG